MKLEYEIVTLCEEVVNILHELREKTIISEEEFNIHSKKKLKFIKEIKESIILQ